MITFYTVVFPTLVCFVYFFIWRIPLDFSSVEKKIRIPFLLLFASFILFLFSYAFPKFFLYFFNEVIGEKYLFFLRNDIWGFVLFGFFHALFCLLPLSFWFDAESNKRRALIRPNNSRMFLFLFLIVFLPNFLLIRAYTYVDEDKIIIHDSFSIFSEERNVSEIKNFVIDSESRTSNTKSGIRQYYILKIFLKWKNEEESLLIETENPDLSLARRTASFIQYLKSNQVTADLPFIILYFSNWRNTVEKFLE